MLFNSIEFAIFLPVVFFVYWFITNNNLKIQNLFILIASFIFYGWWDWRFLILIIISSIVDYTIGIFLSKTEVIAHRKLLLACTLFVNLSILGFFKYFNFFIDSFSNAFSFFGQTIDVDRLNIVLPVGISFYTFQTMSYTIDIFKNKISPTKDIIAFFSFVSFFPQLVAGPIERASNLLPQFHKKRLFNYTSAVDGTRQILWGLFKKIVIADNCAVYANLIFTPETSYSGSTILFGAIFFAIQIYCDFSGYSDIAIGTARIFGFKLMRNFSFPYFSRDIAEFWRRWHISLTTWFRDYVYIPLGGNQGNTIIKIRNTFVVFVLSGFWHGANWTFIAWGVLNALYFIPLLLLNKNRKNLNTIAQGKLFPSFRELIGMISTFLLIVISWIFFRAPNIKQAFRYLTEIFSLSLFKTPAPLPKIEIIIFLFFFILIEWIGRDQQYAIEKFALNNIILRWSFYIGIVIIMFMFAGTTQDFIYFQF
jgi:D-alanyl-lipoteichoic acid acyltransferase DltB (MBOAT superfamily)